MQSSDPLQEKGGRVDEGPPENMGVQAQEVIWCGRRRIAADIVRQDRCLCPKIVSEPMRNVILLSNHV